MEWWPETKPATMETRIKRMDAQINVKSTKTGGALKYQKGISILANANKITK